MSHCRFRMGVPASGNRVPGDLPVPAVDAVEAAPAHPHIPDCPVGLPVADLQDHARSSKWSSSVWCLGSNGGSLTCAASRRGEPVSLLPHRPLSSRRHGLAHSPLFCPFRGLCLNTGGSAGFSQACSWSPFLGKNHTSESISGDSGALGALLPPSPPVLAGVSEIFQSSFLNDRVSGHGGPVGRHIRG